MSWIENALMHVEATLRAIFEGNPDGLPRKLSAQLAKALDEAMRQEMIRLPGGSELAAYTHIAPDEYTLILPASQAKMVLEHPQVLDRLAERLARGAAQAHIQLAGLPILRCVASPTGQALHVQAEFGHQGVEDSSTTEYEPILTAKGSGADLRAFLIVNGLETYPITLAVTNIGSDLTNQLVLGEASVAPKHAQLRLINQRHVIFDLGSKSGTYVNGAAVSSSMLRPGDVIRLGGIPIVYGQEAAAHLGHTQKMDGNQGPVEIL